MTTNGRTIIFSIISGLTAIGCIALWSFLMKKTSLWNLDSKRKNLYTGIVFGIITVIRGMIFDYAICPSTDTVIFGNCGLLPLCVGLCFGGSAGIISAGIGMAYELIALACGMIHVTQLADAICQLAVGINVWLSGKYLFKGAKPSYNFTAFCVLAFSAFNVMTYVMVEFIDLYNIQWLTVHKIAVLILLNLIVVEGAMIITNKIEYGVCFKKEEFNNTVGKLKATIIIPLVITIVVLTAFSYIYLSFVLWEPASTWAKENLYRLSNMLILKETPDALGKKDIPVAYKDGRIIVADRDGDILIGELPKGISLEDAGIIIEEDTPEPDGMIAYIDGVGYNCVYMTAGDYEVIELIPQTTIYEYRDALVVTVICMQLLILYITVWVVMFNVNRMFLEEAERTIEILGKVVGRGSNTAADGYDMFSSSITRNLKEIAGRINDEMAFAADVQMQSLPMRESTKDGIGIRALIKPARQIGGDFYDYFMLDASRWLFLIADVSGKGMSAAMFMMKAKAAVRSLAYDEYDMEKLLMKVNFALCAGNPEGMFVAMWVGIIDTKRQTVQYINSAIGDQIIRYPHQDYEFIEDIPQAPLGVKKDKEYHSRTLEFKPGSRLFLCTDGVTEANNVSGEMYSEERLIAFLNEGCRASNGQETVELLTDDLKEHIGRAEQFDDITILVVDYFGDIEKHDVSSMTICAEDEKLDEATDFINEVISPLNCDDAKQMEIDVAFEELFVNISHYAYPQSKGNVTIDVSTDNGMVMVRLTDEGIPFNPLRTPKQDENTPLQERKEGGLGITMVKTCMDYVDYQYEDGRNIFTMIKYVG